MEQKKCPECKGQKSNSFPSNNTLNVYGDHDVVYEDVVCPECKGAGVVDALHEAIYKARGGSATQMMKYY